MRTLSREDALADELLLHGAVGGGELLLATLELLGRASAFIGGLDLVEAVLALLLAGDLQRGGQVGGRGGLDGGVGVVLVVEEDRELLDRLGGRGGELGLGLAQRLDELLGGLEALGDDLLGRAPACPGS